MVLSETFRQWLFLVVRGGIGFIERLGAGSTRSLTGLIMDTHPEVGTRKPGRSILSWSEVGTHLPRK
jgi:hypothetical protein